MKHYAESSSHQLLQQPIAEQEMLRQALIQEREQAALAREETESFRHQLQKLKIYAKDAQNEAKEAKEKVLQLQQRLAEAERVDSPAIENSAQASLYQRQAAAAEAENASYRARLEKVALILREKEKKIAELHQYEISFRKISEQKSLHDAIIERHLERIRSLEEELGSSSQRLQERDQQISLLEALVHDLRLQEEAHQQEMQMLQAQFTSLKESVDDSKKEIEEAASRKNELESFLQAVEAESLEGLRIKLSAIQEELQAAKKAAADKQLLQAGKEALEVALTEAKCAQDDAEARLKTAHQHLAKKVKETALLNDSAQLHQEQLHDLQMQLNQARLKVAEMQQALDAHVLQEGRLQEQIQQSSRSMEALAGRWEEKYFKIYEKWQESEVKIREMKKLEEKCSQMQSLLVNISSVFGMPVGQAAQPAPQMAIQQAAVVQTASADAPAYIPIHEAAAYEEEPSSPAFYGQLAQPHLHSDDDDSLFTAAPSEALKVDDSVQSPKGPYQSLFDMPQQAKRLKNTFFD